MLLVHLKEYADERMGLPPTLYVYAPVRYIIDLDPQGRLLSREPVDTADPSDHSRRSARRRGESRLVPQVQRSSGVRPLLLADNAEYTLGLAKKSDNPRPDRTAACHAAYVELVERCAQATGAPQAHAVLTFLRDAPAERLTLPEGFDRNATITFRVDGAFVADLPSVREFWAAVNDPAIRDAPVMQCGVCGQRRPVTDRLQGKIKRIPGGQTSGTAIISANAEAFESYGLTASLIFPTCAACGQRFTLALNHLLEQERSRVFIGGVAFVFWTRGGADIPVDRFITNPDEQQVRGLIESVRTGRRQPEVGATAFYATSLSGSGGRVVVRDWLDTTVEAVEESLARWFQRQRTVGPWGELPRPFSVFALADATVRQRRDLAPPTPRALISAALRDRSIPLRLLHQAVQRTRAQQEVAGRPKVAWAQAALIKAALLGQPDPIIKEGDAMEGLNENMTHPAYLCGRLLAVLERVQLQAMPNVNATVADRHYGTASVTPRAVIPYLMRRVRPHLATLRRDNPGAYYALQEQMDNLFAHFSSDESFPRVLTPEEQGLFVLGYYHQRAYSRAQMMERRQARGAAADDNG